MFTNSTGIQSQELVNVINNWVNNIDTDLTQTTDVDRVYRKTTDEIVFNTGDGEMLRVAEDGFWVRGVKVEQNGSEAETVYHNFRQWLIWAQLNRE